MNGAGKIGSSFSEPPGGFQYLDQIVPDVPQVCRTFKVQFIGGFHHFPGKFVQSAFSARSFQQTHRLVKVPVVIIDGNAANTRSGAVANHIRMAVPEVMDSRIFCLAGSQPEMPVEPFLRGVKSLGVDKGAEVARSVIFAHSRQLETRQFFPLRNFQQGVALVVLHLDIVIWTILFNQFAFQQKSLLVISGFKIIK